VSGGQKNPLFATSELKLFSKEFGLGEGSLAPSRIPFPSCPVLTFSKVDKIMSALIIL
jgi:hypothetical protein